MSSNKMLCLFKISILYLTLFLFVLAQDPVANLPQGRIVGIKVYTEGSRTPVEIYFGVPYAVAPVGRYRFSAPERHPGWRRTLFAHRMPPHCPHEGDPESEHSAEDCLYLNICTPRPADGFALPVIVIFYSESWTRGGPVLPCQELASEGVVVVTVAYRLHILAFFTLRLLSARGNLALLDQYLSLLWVRDNIAAFGGDPTSITVLGHSAGADSILYHLASPRAIGLFQRAVLMSPQYIWEIIDEQNASNASEVEKISREIANALGCQSESDLEILNCMRSRPMPNILSVYRNAHWSKGMQPTTDEYLPQSERYLPSTLMTALSSMKPQISHIDLLFGTTDLEILSNNDKNYEELMKLSSSNISDYTNEKAIPRILRMFSFHGTRELPMLVRAIRWEYWSENKYRSNNENIDSVENLARIESTARWGVGGALLAARLARRYSKLYVYRYSQPAGVDILGRQFNFSGAVHGTDLVSLLGNALMLQVARRAATNDEKRLTSQFRQYIINFAKYGSPGSSSEWQQYGVGDAQICDIRDESSHANSFSASKDVKFWLQYLPELVNLISSFEGTEQLSLERGESRLRGGVFAMCGVSTILLLLLAVCAILLRRHRSGRYSVPDESLH
ncbi:hypothetical protein O3G_MSEX001330 [Manduca sexta]|uniref:Carboxylic ester hydrolase n=1 Tax=Manduca sexta TaxID=7130 RepID=A0A921YJY3_MANSE|nr:hypothetical protein O3G_MSEX001330 [Manduca sexta]